VITCGPAANVIIPAFVTVGLVELAGKLIVGLLVKTPAIVTPAVEKKLIWPFVLAVCVPVFVTLPVTLTAPTGEDVTMPVPLFAIPAMVVAAVKFTLPELVFATLPTVVAAVNVTAPEPEFVTFPTVNAAVTMTVAPLLAEMLPVAVATVNVNV